MEERNWGPSATVGSWREAMRTPEDVAAIVRLGELGWGSRRISRELGIARNTVRRYLRAGGYRPYQRPDRVKCLEHLQEWLRSTFLQHRGNAAVVHRELRSQHGLEVTLRTVQRAVAPFRRELEVQAKATVRFETRPGRQLQADFGQRSVQIGGKPRRVHFAVLTLGFSRRIYVKPWPCERQWQWLRSFELAFEHFGGVPDELLLDNARSLVSRHDRLTREVVFNERLAAFCRYWGVAPRACAPYRARTKGKDERAVRYVKESALAGYEFDSWQHMEAHLARWSRDVADQRVHGTTGDRPIDRFERAERPALRPLEGRPPFAQRRSLSRRVQSDCCVEVDTNRYSVPSCHVGAVIRVHVTEEELTMVRDGEVIATHAAAHGRRQWVVKPAHMPGVVRPRAPAKAETASSSLQRPLSEYEAVVAGRAR